MEHKPRHIRKTAIDPADQLRPIVIERPTQYQGDKEDHQLTEETPFHAPETKAPFNPFGGLVAPHEDPDKTESHTDGDTNQSHTGQNPAPASTNKHDPAPSFNPFGGLTTSRPNGEDHQSASQSSSPMRNDQPRSGNIRPDHRPQSPTIQHNDHPTASNPVDDGGHTSSNDNHATPASPDHTNDSSQQDGHTDHTSQAPTLCNPFGGLETPRSTSKPHGDERPYINNDVSRSTGTASTSRGTGVPQTTTDRGIGGPRLKDHAEPRPVNTTNDNVNASRASHGNESFSNNANDRAPHRDDRADRSSSSDGTSSNDNRGRNTSIDSAPSHKASVSSPSRRSAPRSSNGNVNARFGSSHHSRRSQMNYSGFSSTDFIDPTEDVDEDDPFGVNDYADSQFNEGWSDDLDDDSESGNSSDMGMGSFLDEDSDDSSDDADDDDPFGLGSYAASYDGSNDDTRSKSADTASEIDGSIPSSSAKAHGTPVDLNLNSHDVKMRADRSRIDVDALTAASRVDTSADGGSYDINQTALREGVQVGTVKSKLSEFIHNPKTVDKAIARQIQLLEFKKKKRIPFSTKIPRILDFLSRWRIATTLQLARVAGWKDTNEPRLVKKLRVYDEVGWMRENVQFAGPRVWTDKDQGAMLGMHPWLGGIKSQEINPMSQSHTFGLTSIASWILCPWPNSPNVLGLDPDEWTQIRKEIKNGDAYLLSEKEYRSSWSSIRRASKGLLPSEYRHGFIGYSGGQLDPVSGAWQEWALSYKNGDARLEDSPEFKACAPEYEGKNLWMWTIWGNGVWNPKELEDKVMLEEGIDLDDPQWSGREGELRLRSEFRRYGYVDVEDRLDIATNKPVVRKDLGDQFALWDHLPDMIIARKRTDDGYADPQSLAIELELTAKPHVDSYARTMAAYGSPLGKTLYQRVIWVVSSIGIAKMIQAGANKVGMVLGEDYDIVPFVTSAQSGFYVKKSFWSGADILPARWNQRGKIEPVGMDRSIPLS